MLVEPLDDVDLNVPGVMAMLVAPDAAQLSVLLVPESMLVGSAAKDVIVGTELFSEAEPDEFVEPQATSPAQANRISTSEQTFSPEKSRPGKLRSFRQDELVESMCDPKQTQSMAHVVAAVALRGPSP
jgi:hypothetical protein